MPEGAFAPTMPRCDVPGPVVESAGEPHECRPGDRVAELRKAQRFVEGPPCIFQIRYEGVLAHRCERGGGLLDKYFNQSVPLDAWTDEHILKVANDGTVADGSRQPGELAIDPGDHYAQWVAQTSMSASRASV